MRTHLFIFIILALLASVHHSFADLRIVSAYFGRPNHNVDVRGVIEQYVDQGIYSFRVSGANLGGWQNPGRTDFLRVVYEANGRRYTTGCRNGRPFASPTTPVSSSAPTALIDTARGTGRQRFPPAVQPRISG
jgi:hypothetical protein